MTGSAQFKIGIASLVLGLAGAMYWTLLHRNGTALALQPKIIATPASGISTVHNPTSSAVPVIAHDGFPSPDASATDEELLARAREAVAISPLTAIDWARSQNDSTLSRRLLSAVLRAWGERDPEAAVDWALTQEGPDRRIDVEAAFAGAASQPREALAMVRQLLKYDPDDTAACGPAFIVALSRAGQFQTALEFLNGAPAENRAEWASATFQQWGRSQPQDALDALSSISDDTLRTNAYQALVDGWSSVDPSALATYANTLPAGADRDYAMQHAVGNWSLQDPAGMAAWLINQPPGPEFDQAVTEMLAKTDGAIGTPEVAMSWVENVTDPALKLKSLVHVMEQWNQSDPAAAQQYLAQAPWIDDQQRQEILKRLQPVSPPADE